MCEFEGFFLAQFSESKAEVIEMRDTGKVRIEVIRSVLVMLSACKAKP